jgi:predicted ester cyclase
VAGDLEEIYRRYIAVLNDRRFEDLDDFVHPRLTYNGESWTREEYRSLLVDSARSIPDLHYDIALLVVGPDHIACRLWFACRPQGDFLGVPVDGRHVSFAEHVFYRLRAGMIEDVWSLIDTDAIRRQLGVGA